MSGSISIYSGTILGTPGARAGVASITIDGEAFDAAGDVVYSATNLARETLIGQSGIQGFSEVPKAGFIAARIRDAASMNVAAFMGKRNSTVEVVTASGKRITGAGMWCTECSEVATQEATFTLRFEGPSVVELSL